MIWILKIAKISLFTSCSKTVHFRSFEYRYFSAISKRSSKLAVLQQPSLKVIIDLPNNLAPVSEIQRNYTTALINFGIVEYSNE